MGVRVGVLGVAGMGLYHLITAPKIEGYELSAICDVSTDALDVAGNAAEGAQRFTDIDALCDARCLDAIVIASPNWMHAGHVRAALEAGLHVYCEKPLGITAGESRRLGEMARSKGLVLQVGFQHRFQHNYATAHRLVASGELGALQHCNLIATDWFRPDAYFRQRSWRARWAEAGGGVLMLQAIHQLDAFLWIVGMPRRITARAWATREGVEVEDDLYAVLEFENGCRGMLVASTIDPAGRNRIEIGGDRGSIVAAGEGLRVGTTPRSIRTILDEEENVFAPVPITWEDVSNDGEPSSFDDCVVACHRDFVAAIEGGHEPRNTGAEATKAIEVADAAYLSALTGEPVDLPLDTDRYDDAFRRMCAGELRLPGSTTVDA